VVNVSDGLNNLESGILLSVFNAVHITGTAAHFVGVALRDLLFTLSAMDEVESHDQFRFGKARLAREKELRDPDDVFIHAEERRRELARQGKKPPPFEREQNTPRSAGRCPQDKTVLISLRFSTLAKMTAQPYKLLWSDAERVRYG